MSNESSKDRTGLCSFTFDDGRHCAMPQADAKIPCCYFHAKREQERLRAEEMGLRFARFLNGDVQTACDLGATFAMLFVWTASGYLSPQTANSLTRLGQLMLKTHSLARAEFVSTWQERWPQVVAESEAFNCNAEEDDSGLQPHNAAPAPSRPKAPQRPALRNLSKLQINTRRAIHPIAPPMARPIILPTRPPPKGAPAHPGAARSPPTAPQPHPDGFSTPIPR